MSTDLLPLAPGVPSATTVATADRRASRQDAGTGTDFGRELSRELTRSSTRHAVEPTEAASDDVAGSADETASTTTATTVADTRPPAVGSTTDEPPTLIDGVDATVTAASLLVALTSANLEMSTSANAVATTGTPPTDSGSAATTALTVAEAGVASSDSTETVVSVAEGEIAIAQPSAEPHPTIGVDVIETPDRTVGLVAGAADPAEPPATGAGPADVLLATQPTSPRPDEREQPVEVVAPGESSLISTPSGTTTEPEITVEPAGSTSPAPASTPTAAEPTVAGPVRSVEHGESVEQPEAVRSSAASIEKPVDFGPVGLAPVDHRPDAEPFDAGKVDTDTQGESTNSASLAPTATTPVVDRPTLHFERAAQVAVADKGGALADALAERLHVDHVNGPRIVGAARLLRHGPGAPATMTVTLDPASLGRVRVELTSHEGQLAVRLHAEQAQGVQAIGAGLDHLRDSLEAEGLRLADVGVGLSGSNGGADRGTTDHRDGSNGGIGVGDSSVEPEMTTSAIRPTRLADGLIDVNL